MGMDQWRAARPATDIAGAWRAFAAGHHAEAADCAQRILDRSPQDPAALTLIARLALASGEPALAQQIVRGVLDRYPDKAALWLDLALALRELGRQPEALEAVQRAIALQAADPALWITLGELRLSLDERVPAAEAFRRALEIASDSVAALRGLCQAEEMDPDAEIAERMRTLIRSPSLKPTESAGLEYALARICRRAGRRKQFIRHLFAANALQRSLSAHGRAEYEAIFDRLESAFTSEAFAAAARADPVEPRPLFILGMPRSGTTLLERLFAAHPDVRAGGELDYLRRSLRRAVERRTGRAFPDGFESIPAPDMTSIARAYAQRLALVGRGSPVVTDKTPGNFHLLGLLRVLFPNGRIVHVARDPMDSCFSILQCQFDDRSPHTCDVDLLAYVYARYRRLMDRWQELFGNEFITVHYERLVEFPAVEGRRVFGHCGLEWSDRLLEFHHGGGAVRTFSAAQVRQPIHTRSIGVWREFADELAPLRSALQRELS
ncbi:MAG: tetratricopeptide repeat-containing sulfotransferase family protein [Steroidobacteraceae bacterium]